MPPQMNIINRFPKSYVPLALLPIWCRILKKKKKKTKQALLPIILGGWSRWKQMCPS